MAAGTASPMAEGRSAAPMVTVRSASLTVTIVRTGVANLASVVAAFERLGARTHITHDPAEVAAAEHVMLPGVGAFGAGMGALAAHDLGRALSERIAADRPTVAICLGLQLLCQHSEETPGIAGLGVVPAAITRFDDSHVKVPQLGWNRVEVPAGARYLEPGHAYFANSFRIADGATLAGFAVATADYDGPFVAALERGRLLACQFHPELSGPWGSALLQRWLEAD